MKLSVDFVKYNMEAMAPIILNMRNIVLRTVVIPDSWK